MFGKRLVFRKHEWMNEWIRVTQSCLMLCHPMDYSLPGFSVHGIFQARILESVAISFSRESFWPRDRTRVPCTAGRLFTIRTTRETKEKLAQSCPTLCNPIDCSPWSSPGQNTGVGSFIASPVDLPKPGIEWGFPALQEDSLPAELSGKSHEGIHEDFP